MRKKIPAVNALTILSICFVVTYALFPTEPRAQSPVDNAAKGYSAPAVTQIEPKYVCMINNQYFTREQIPVVVGEKTYYGCCEMCEERLKTDPVSRTAIDPVSGDQVDKAASVIGATADGKVLYFENVENLKIYNNNLNSKD